MIKIIIEAEGKTSELKIGGISEQLLLTDIIPSIKLEPAATAKFSTADIIKSLLSDLLRNFVRGRASLWKDN